MRPQVHRLIGSVYQALLEEIHIGTSVNAVLHINCAKTKFAVTNRTSYSLVRELIYSQWLIHRMLCKKLIFSNGIITKESCNWSFLIPEQFTAIGPLGFIWRGGGRGKKNCGGTLSRGFGLRSFRPEITPEISAWGVFFWPEIYCEGPLYEYEYGYEYWFTDS